MGLHLGFRIAQLGEAELNLEWTELHAPSRGVVVDLTIGEGTFAKAGQGLMNLLSFEEVWVEAYLTENNLAKVSVGDPAEIVLHRPLRLQREPGARPHRHQGHPCGQCRGGSPDARHE